MNSLLASLERPPEPISTRKKRRVRDGKWLCVKGHDKNVVGASKEGACKKCRNERSKEKRMKRSAAQYIHFLDNFTNPICPNLHDKRIVGVTPDRRCYECFKEHSKKRQRAKRRSSAEFRGDSSFMPGLESIRKSLGLSRAALGAMTGYKPDTIGKIERGHKKASRRGQLRIVAAIASVRRKRRELYLER